MESNYFNARDLRIVKLAEEICDGIWELVDKWAWMAKKTVGIQLINAADSIGANICEGQGRHHKKDNIRFLYISRGSLEETLYWLRRGVKREFLSQEDYKSNMDKLENLRPQLNAFIKSKFRREG
ncbi:four helix bundle protein [Candidatus Margulisiibacteriota bacterium]